MPTFKISTLGCKVNQSESEAIARQLKSCDWLPAGDGDATAITIINTCTVTQKASMQSRQTVRQAIRANPNSRIVVTGCYAQTEPKALEKINGVHYIIGNADKHRIGEILAAATKFSGRSGDRYRQRYPSVTSIKTVTHCRLRQPHPSFFKNTGRLRCLLYLLYRAACQRAQPQLAGRQCSGRRKGIISCRIP